MPTLSAHHPGTNARIAGAACLLLLAFLPFRDVIPAAKGIGYDGVRYAGWTRHFSLEALADGFSKIPGRRSRRLEFDSYMSRKFLPSMVMHYAMQLARVDFTRVNIIAAFTIANVVLVTLAVYWWCGAADELRLSVQSKWLGFLALMVSYANLKMPLFYPIQVDTWALAMGSASLALWLRGRRLALLFVTCLASFTWPSALYFGVLLVAFPRSVSLDLRPGPRGLASLGAAGATVFVIVATAIVVRSGYEPGSTPVRPLEDWIWVSGATAALYLFSGLRPLLDSAAFWESLDPRTLVRNRWLWAGAAVIGLVSGVTMLISLRPARMGSAEFLRDTVYSSVMQPGIFYVAHVLYFGPVVLFLLRLWTPISRAVRAQGTGLVLCFALALGISVGSESRKLINFYPFIVLFLAKGLETLEWTPGRLALLVALSALFSKVWLPMDDALVIPFAGLVKWRDLYVSSRGPWIDHGWYVAQLVAVILALIVLFAAIRPRARAIALSLLVLGLALTACAEAEAPTRHDVLLLMVDTLRADHLGVYGYERPTSPALDRFARSAVVFSDVVAPSSWTLPSVASVLTSAYPSVHGLRVHRKGESSLKSMRPGLATLPETFREAGYRTTAVVANPWVNTRKHGLHDGWDDYRAEATRTSANGLHRIAKRLLEKERSQPLFLYLHYMDVHGPYDAEPSDGADLGSAADRYRRSLTPAEISSIPRYLELEGAERLDSYLDAYDRGIRRWDASFGKLVQWLEKTGRMRTTIVAVIADHGEEFLEHGGWNHGFTVYQEQLQVPWILHIPGAESRRFEAGTASLIDVAPTLLGAIGAEVPATMMGRNLLDRDLEPRALYSETDGQAPGVMDSSAPQVAIRLGAQKLIRGVDGELCFDLGSDPLERAPRRDERCADRVQTELARWQLEMGRRAAQLGEQRAVELTDEQAESLRALGYGE